MIRNLAPDRSNRKQAMEVDSHGRSEGSPYISLRITRRSQRRLCPRDVVDMREESARQLSVGNLPEGVVAKQWDTGRMCHRCNPFRHR